MVSEMRRDCFMAERRSQQYWNVSVAPGSQWKKICNQSSSGCGKISDLIPRHG